MTHPRYRIHAVRGRGGVGTVYEAWDLELERKVALKFLRDDRREHRIRMLREARAQARVDHPNVCRVFDVGEEDDRLHIAMQWIDGQPLDQLSPTLTTEEKVRILRDVAEGAHAAHSEGVIHRDLKPANIMVAIAVDGTLHPYVVDFGLARAMEQPGTTATGEIIGTPHYLSPEQAWGLPADRRSDVYSLGATLYELLSGRLPFTGGTSTDVILQVIRCDPPRLEKIVPAIPRDLSVIVAKCLEKQPERRYDSARALRDDLTRWIEGEPILARAPGTFRRAYAFVRRHRAVATAVVAATVITASIATYQINALLQERARREVTMRLEDHVRYIEALVDYDRRLPIHDARGIRARALFEIENLRKLGAGDAGGALEYAEGRARVAAGDTSGAREALERAWQRGFRTAAVGYHLGIALTAEYARDLAAADRIAQAELRRKRSDELRSQYRAAVLPPLQLARGYVEQPPELIDAHFAYVEGDDATTSRLTQTVLRRFPWNNDARLLEANALVRRAQSERQQGRLSEARTKLGRAENVYAAARLIAPSDLRIHEGLCQATVSLVAISADSSGDMESDFARAREACEAALVIDPERVPVLVALSSAWTRIAFHRGTHGRDFHEEIKPPIALAERALKLAPNDPAALIQAGSVYFFTDINHAPRVAQLMRRAVAVSPESIEARHNLGRGLLLLNDYAQQRGEDAGPILAEGLRVYRDIIRRAPEFVPAYNNLALMLHHTASHTLKNGGNPDPIFEEMIRILEPQIRKHPEVASLCNTAANASINLGYSRFGKGLDATKQVDDAEYFFREALRRKSNYWGDHVGMASIHLMRAETTRDPELRERSFEAASVVMDDLEKRGLPSGRQVLYLMRARFARDRASALRYLAAATSEITKLQAGKPDVKGDISLRRGEVEVIRCRFAPDACDAERRDEYLRRALAADKRHAFDVARLRAQSR